MADTIRTKNDLLALFADNSSRQISPQDLRDFVVSIFNDTETNAAAITAETSARTAADAALQAQISGLPNPLELGQLEPGTTSPEILISGAANELKVVESLFISNNSGAAATFRVFVDADGSVFNGSTAIAFDVSVGAGAVVQMEGPISIPTAGRMAVRSSVAGALAFTAYGRTYAV